MESAQEKQVILAYLKLKLTELQSLSSSNPRIVIASDTIQRWLSKEIKSQESLLFESYSEQAKKESFSKIEE
jgi:hypothetical protein